MGERKGDEGEKGDEERRERKERKERRKKEEKQVHPEQYCMALYMCVVRTYVHTHTQYVTYTYTCIGTVIRNT